MSQDSINQLHESLIGNIGKACDGFLQQPASPQIQRALNTLNGDLHKSGPINHIEKELKTFGGDQSKYFGSKY
jgi:hypothetical protein